MSLEDYSALHDLPFATLNDGYGGLGTELVFNNDHVVALFERLARLAEAGVLACGRRRGDAPPLVSTEERYRTIVMGIQRMVSAAESLPVWNETMALATLAMLPPIVVVVALQRLFLKGLVEPEK